MSAATGTSSRFARGTATACFTCTTPTMSSRSSSITGKREKPVRPDSSSTAFAGSSRCRLSTLRRGVITSPAESSEKRSVRSSSVAVSASSSPALAEWRTSDESSCAERAPESSSWGSMPRVRSTPFALPFSTMTAGFSVVVKAACAGITSRAVASGLEIAKFFGTSSPTIMENTVATATAIGALIARRSSSGTPRAPSGASRKLLSAGSSV